MLLHSKIGENTLWTLPSRQEVPPVEIEEARKLIQGTIAAVQEGSLKLNFPDESLGAVLQALRNRGTENHPQILRQDLFCFISEHLHHPAFQSIAVHLLETFSHAKYAWAEEAKQRLRVFRGESGSVSQILQSSLQDFQRMENHVPLMSAIALAGIGGRLMRVATNSWFRRGGFMAGRSLLAHGVSGLSAIMAESAFFPVGQQMGLAFLGAGINFKSFGEEFAHGIKFMGSLGVTSWLARIGFRAFHGMNHLNQATRFRQAAVWTQPVITLGSEYATLVGLNRFDAPNTFWAHSLIQSAMTMVDLRMAHGLNQGLFLGLEHGYRILDHQAYRAMQQALTNIHRSISRFISSSKVGGRARALQGAGQVPGANSWKVDLVQEHQLDQALMVRGCESPHERTEDSRQPKLPKKPLGESPAIIIPPSLDDITLKVGRRYYEEGVDPLPDVERSARNDYLNAGIPLLGAQRTRTLDLAWALSQRFPHTDPVALMKKLDVSAHRSVLLHMKAALVDVRKTGIYHEITGSENLEAELEALYKRGELSYYDLLAATAKYVHMVPDQEGADIYSPNFLNPEKLAPRFGTILEIPRFEIPKIIEGPNYRKMLGKAEFSLPGTEEIDHSNFVYFFNRPWLLGECVISVIPPYMKVMTDGDPMALKDRAGHDDDHAMSLYANLGGLSRGKQIERVRGRHSFEAGLAKLPFHQQSIGNSMWFGFDHESGDLSSEIPTRNSEPLLQALRELQTRKINWIEFVEARNLKSRVVAFLNRVLKRREEGGLIAPEINVRALTLEDFIEPLELINRVFG